MSNPTAEQSVEEKMTALHLDDYRQLLIAAYGVANAIEVGAGGLIKGTLMEKEFRDALALLPGELVRIPK